jgi:flagellar biosynthetic protein FliP
VKETGTQNIRRSRNNTAKRVLFFLILCVAFYLVCIWEASAADFLFPKVHIGVEKGEGPGDISVLLQIVFLLTVLSLAPAILMLMTSFTRLAVVFAFLRHALGTQQTPSNQIIAGLALFLTFFIMMPVWQKVNSNALQPYLNEEISQEVALKEIPAFVISELKTAFIIGFVLYVPFLIIDMVVASVLLSMGMMMLPPILISLPFKLMLFVLVDGWHLIVGSMVKSFMGG